MGAVGASLLQSPRVFFVDDKSLGKLIKDKLPALQLAIIYYR